MLFFRPACFVLPYTLTFVLIASIPWSVPKLVVSPGPHDRFATNHTMTRRHTGIDSFLPCDMAFNRILRYLILFPCREFHSFTSKSPPQRGQVISLTLGSTSLPFSPFTSFLSALTDKCSASARSRKMACRSCKREAIA
jgi:hypothetical protein